MEGACCAREHHRGPHNAQTKRGPGRPKRLTILSTMRRFPVLPTCRSRNKTVGEARCAAVLRLATSNSTDPYADERDPMLRRGLALDIDGRGCICGFMKKKIKARMRLARSSDFFLYAIDRFMFSHASFP